MCREVSIYTIPLYARAQGYLIGMGLGTGSMILPKTNGLSTRLSYAF
jgi:hypothetical protein